MTNKTTTKSYFIKSTDYTKHSDDVRLDFEFDNDDTEKTTYFWHWK